MTQRSLVPHRARVLHAASVLREFTLAELKSFAGVTYSTARTVLARAPEYFEHLETVFTGKRGGQPARYRFREDRREALEAEFRSVTTIAATPSFKPPTVTERFHAALNAAREMLEESPRDPSTTDERDEWAAIVRIRLMSVRAALHLARESPDFPKLEQSYQALSSAVERRVGIGSVAGELSASSGRAVPEPRLAVLEWFGDWATTRERVVRVAESSSQREEGEERLNALLGGSDSELDERDVLIPAAFLALRLRRIRPEGAKEVQSQILAQLAGGAALAQPQKFAALVACAAISNAWDAVPILLNQTNHPDFQSSFRGNTRRICLLAIARFARPGTGSDIERAAAMSRVLLDTSTSREEDLPILLPGALTGRHELGRGLLDEFANAGYSSPSVMGPLGYNERWLMRNVASAFCVRRLRPLVESLSGLLSRPYGFRFLQALNDQRHGAIRFRRHREEFDFVVSPGEQYDFVVSPGEEILRTGDLADAYDVPVPFGQSAPEGRKLSELIFLSSKTFRKGAFSEDSNEHIPEDEPSFKRLHRKRAAELRAG